MKVLIEAEVVEQVNKDLYSSHTKSLRPFEKNRTPCIIKALCHNTRAMFSKSVSHVT